MNKNRFSLVVPDATYGWLERFSSQHQISKTEVARKCLSLGMFILDNYYEHDKEIYFKSEHLGDGEEVRLVIL